MIKQRLRMRESPPAIYTIVLRVRPVPFRMGCLEASLSQLYVRFGESGSKRGWCNDSCPGFKKINESLRASELLQQGWRYVAAGDDGGSDKQGRLLCPNPTVG